MENNYLIEILNSNNNLLQDLDNNEYIKSQFLGLLRNIEITIPQDSRENFYTNLKTLRLSARTMKEAVFGAYLKQTNTICINKDAFNILNKDGAIQNNQELEDLILMSIYHELLHMAQTTRDETTNYYATGFQHIERNENGEILYEEELKGMTEGFTELLTLQAFGKKIYESFSSYGRQANLLAHLSLLTDLDTIKRACFNNRNGMLPIDRTLGAIDGINSHLSLYQDIEKDYRVSEKKSISNSSDANLLTSIEMQLLQLSSKKIKMLLEKNPRMSREDISDFWMRITETVNFPEKLELMGEDPKRYNGIFGLREMFMKLRQETMTRGNSIQIEDIKKAIGETKISDINSEINSIKQKIQIDKEAERSDQYGK